jgi:hypothetical protein
LRKRFFCPLSCCPGFLTSCPQNNIYFHGLSLLILHASWLLASHQKKIRPVQRLGLEGGVHAELTCDQSGAGVYVVLRPTMLVSGSPMSLASSVDCASATQMHIPFCRWISRVVHILGLLGCVSGQICDLQSAVGRGTPQHAGTSTKYRLVPGFSRDQL